MLSCALMIGAMFAPASVQAETPGCPDGGAPVLAFTHHGRRIFTWQGSPYRDYFVTMGLRTLDLPDHLIMESGGHLAVSRDEGCSWELIRELPGSDWPLWITAGPNGAAYAFALNGSALYRVEYDGANFAAIELHAPVSNILGLGVDADDAQRIRIGDSTGQVHESLDGGDSWSRVGTRPPVGPLTYRIAFDPNDLDHMIFGAAVDGGWVTFDGAATWTPIVGLSETNGPVNLFNAVFSPVDSNVAWCMAIDLDQADAGHPSQGRHIYLSRDGGLTFEPVVDNAAGVTLSNGPELTPHPFDPNRIGWAWGSRWDGMYVYQFDASARRLRTAYRAGMVARTMEFYRADPRHAYVGLEAF